MARRKLLALCFLLAFTAAAAAATSVAEAHSTPARRLGGYRPSPEGEPPVAAEEQEEELLESHHSTVDRSIAGGGVILGGLATAFLVGVFCYIRATRRRKARDSNEMESPASTV